MTQVAITDDDDDARSQTYSHVGEEEHSSEEWEEIPPSSHRQIIKKRTARGTQMIVGDRVLQMDEDGTVHERSFLDDIPELDANESASGVVSAQHSPTASEHESGWEDCDDSDPRQQHSDEVNSNSVATSHSESHYGPFETEDDGEGTSEVSIYRPDHDDEGSRQEERRGGYHDMQSFDGAIMVNGDAGGATISGGRAYSQSIQVNGSVDADVMSLLLDQWKTRALDAIQRGD